MANQEQQNDSGVSDGASQPHAISPQGAARRRFAKVGLGASGVIMTLVSQPGMAANVCTPPSGFLSGAWASQNPNSVCFGRSPGYWKEHPELWAATLGEVKFSRTFTLSSHTAALSPYTLFEVVDSTKVPNDADKHNVAMHIVAAFLNARYDKVSVLPEARVREIWNEYSSTGFYTPNAGAAKWDGEAIVKYLKSTMI